MRKAEQVAARDRPNGLPVSHRVPVSCEHEALDPFDLVRPFDCTPFDKLSGQAQGRRE
jgi:hypothetical protein